MFPNSTLCRAQEAFHRVRAADAKLENVRVVAAQAAIAWGQEADSAERREARHRKVRAVSDIAAALKQQGRDERDRLFSENPDRGFEAP